MSTFETTLRIRTVRHRTGIYVHVDTVAEFLRAKLPKSQADIAELELRRLAEKSLEDNK